MRRMDRLDSLLEEALFHRIWIHVGEPGLDAAGQILQAWKNGIWEERECETILDKFVAEVFSALLSCIHAFIRFLLRLTP